MKKIYCYGAIQNALIAYEMRHGECASVGEVLPLIDDFRVMEDGEICPPPDFSAWDLKEARTLLELFSHVCLEAERIASDFDYWISSRVARVQASFDIFVFLHLSHHKCELRKKEVVEFCYVLEGGARLYQENGQHLLRPGDFALIGPENIHDIVAEGGSAVLGIQIPCQRFTQYCLAFMQRNNMLVHILGQLLYGGGTDYYVVHAEPTVDIKRVIRAMFCEFRQYEPYSAAICTNLLEVLLYKVLQSYGEADGTPHLRGAELVFSTAMNEIYRQRSLTLKALSEKLSYSEGYLSRLIRRKTGRTFNDLVAQVRHDRAVRLLTHTALPMSDVAEYAGYASQNQFSRAFREKTGMTPSQYRRERSGIE